MLTPATVGAGGGVFWQADYTGGAVAVTFLGTYTSTKNCLADGYTVELFITPSTWAVAPQYNYSIPASFGNTYFLAGGVSMLPQSSSPYIYVQFDPVFHYYPNYGDWNIAIISNPSGSSPSVSPCPSPNAGSGYCGWTGYGTNIVAQTE